MKVLHLVALAVTLPIAARAEVTVSNPCARQHPRVTPCRGIPDVGER